MPPKSSIAQRDFLIAKLKRHLAKIEKAIDDSNTQFQIDKTIDDLEKIRKDIEISTMFLVDHPTENMTVDTLITDFTALEDSIDDVCDRFQDMFRRSKNETNEQQQTQSVSITTDGPNDETAQAIPIVDTEEQTPAVAVGSSASPQPISHLSRPQIKIEPYDGNPLKWNTWFGLFKTLIHDQPISNAEKMTHLQTLTTGTAQQAISGFSCNSSMYNAALAELQRRFGRPEVIINNFLRELRSFPQPSTHEKDSFMTFSTFVNNLVETFQSLGFTHDLHSTIYVQFLPTNCLISSEFNGINTQLART